MPVLILAPVLEVLEDGVNLVLWVRLEVPEDGDVPPVPNFLRQVGGVEDELGLKKVYFLALVRNPRSSAKLKSDRPLFKNLDSANHKKFSS